MAVEFGAAVLSSFLGVALDRIASPKLMNFFRERNFDHGLIKKLETKMLAFSSILDDAEEKQFANEYVRKWLLELKEAAYDAEDLLDEIEYEAQRRQALPDPDSLSGSGDPLTEKIERKLKEILERLGDLIKNSEALGLKKGMEERRLSVSRETTSLPNELDGFYGRDGDKEAIRSLLLSDDANAGNLGVIPIVGMGGIGKTTLAQHVYNDVAVAEQFNIRGWICVSVEFTVLRLTKLILEEVTRRASDSNNLNQLQINLKYALHGKKFLLVLDDVWSEDYDGWNKLLTPLRYGAAGSKIVITTRQERVASMVQTVPPHFLKELEDQECWNLFVKHACYDVNSAANPPELEFIGKEIVRKCGGLPLAAKALGGVLRWHTKVEKWEQVLKSEIWDVENANILSALAMSYIHLPSDLKRCFDYCAIFPQDYEFQKEELVALWMSEGFLVRQKGNQSLEGFDDLVSRSFFQHSSNSGEPCFVMHDLVHDLARFVSREFCYRLEGGTSWKIGKRTRHVSHEGTEEDDLMKFQGMNEIPFLRSFVLAHRQGCSCNLGRRSTCISDVIRGLLSRRKLLRVLSLSCYIITELPNSIGALKHMRHLDLSYTSIRRLPETVTALFNLVVLTLRGCHELEELPADIARLLNLEILILRRCTKLVVLPNGISRLIHLCQLDLRGTNKLKGMPPEMGKLKKLSKLSDFVVGDEGSNIEELRQLHYLTGEIFIWGLQNVKDVRDASEVILKDKENLKKLQLEWNGDADDSRQVKQVLEKLQPHMEIECLWIRGYGGSKFPNWVGDFSYSKLKKLCLDGCKNCFCLPPLGQLASLEELSIDGKYNEVLEAIGVEFYGMSKPGEKPFSSLKRLEFRGMKNWRRWSSFNGGAFPFLEELELHDCSELLSVPTHLSSLKRLRIEYCSKLDFENLFSTCAALETIRISGCDKVKCISAETFPNLKELDIWNCLNLESLWSIAATTTTTTTTSDPLIFPSLTSLSIGGCSELVSFPSGGLHAPHLKIMDLSSCRNLKLLPQGMRSLLPSLVSFRMYRCPEIESLPEEGLPASLSSLEICGCPLLEKRCEPEIGEDWPKIKHIPHLDID